MKAAYLFAVLLLCAFSAHAQPKKDTKLPEALTDELNSFRKTSLIPGFGVTIVNANGIVYSRGFGSASVSEAAPFTPMTISWVGSVSKTFIGLAVMKLVEQGKLDLDAPISSILPYRIVNPHHPDVPITVRHLMTHTSSITDSFETYSVGDADVVLENENDPTQVPAYIAPNVAWHKMGRKISLDEFVRRYTQPAAKWYSAGTFAKDPPGSRFHYSNLAAAIAARVVEERAGMSFRDFTRKYIFAPLKMKNTSWDLPELNKKLVATIYVHNDEKDPSGTAEYPQYYITGYPSGGLRTNITDLGKYLVEMIRGYNGTGRLLNKKAYRILFEPQLNRPHLPKVEGDIVKEGGNIASFWSIKKDGNYEHLGGNIGVYAFIKFDPVNKTGSLAMCNLRDNSFGDIQEIVYKYEERFGRR
jgi:CubicO group peptidase (beta-lactamase class C family)